MRQFAAFTLSLLCAAGSPPRRRPPLPGTPAVAANGSGEAIAVANTGGALPDIGPHTVGSAFSDGAFSDPGRLTGANIAMGSGSGGVLLYGCSVSSIRSAARRTQGSTLYARIRTAGSTLRSRRRVGATVRGQHLAPSVTLSRHRAGAQGRALVAWTAFDGDPVTGRFSTRLAQLRGAANSPSQSLFNVQTVSDPAVDTVLSDLVADPEGATYVLMLAGVRGNDPSPTAPGVSVRASGAEEVAPPATGAAAPSGVDATLLPDGRVLAVWGTGGGAAFSMRATPTR